MSVDVTVLMAVFNGARYLREAVDSILDQTFHDFEFLIVDDGSTDATAGMLDDYARNDPRVRIIHQANAGLAQALNNGVAEAAGGIIIRMDADDVAVPTRIAEQVAYLVANPEVAAVGSFIQYIDEKGRPTGTGTYATAPGDVVNALIEGHSTMAHPAVAMRRDAVLAVGGYRPAFAYAEDADLWQRLAEHHLIANIPEVLLNYRIHENNVSKVHHFRQALSAYAARYAGKERRRGNPDPLAGATHLCIADLDHFALSAQERKSILGYLANAAVKGFETSGDAQLLDEAEACLVRLGAMGTSKARGLSRRLARHRLQRGEWRRAVADLGSSTGRLRKAGRGLAQAARWPADEIRYRRLAAALVHCADPAHGGSPPDVRLTADSYRQLVEQADAHAVLPAVLRSLQPSTLDIPGLDQVTTDATARLRMLTTHSMMLRGFADTLLAELDAGSVALLKGLTFARAIYPNPQLRPFTDIDLLVAPSAKARVEEVLARNGFVFAAEGHDPVRREDKWLHRQNRTLLVEIHANMVHAPSLQGALTLSLEDLASVGIGSPAAHLMVAAMHGALHQYESLRQVVDILQAARHVRTPADEQQMQSLVERTGGRLAAVTGLDLAWRMFREPRCRDLARGLGPARHGRAARLLINRDVVLSMTNERRVYYTWRRQGFRELLKRGSFSPGLGVAGVAGTHEHQQAP